MPRLSRFPSYPRKPHSSGQARIKIRGQVYYLGAFGSPASWAEYRRLLAEWERGAQTPPSRKAAQSTRLGTVNELLAAFGEHAAGYYRKDGKSTGQLERVNRSLGFVRALFGPRKIEDFDQQALDLVRAEMVRADYCRGHVNQCVGCIRRAWKWAAARQLIPAELWRNLTLLEDLRKGRSPAREAPPVRPVDPAIVEQTLPFVTPPVAALARLQLLAGMRPGEVILLRLADIDRRGPVWAYWPHRHKNEHRGQPRTIWLGPRAQAVIRPFLVMPGPTDDPKLLELLAGNAPDYALIDRCEEIGARIRGPEEYLFVPREAATWLAAERRKKRRTKVYRCEGKRRKPRPQRSPGRHYSRISYGKAIERACQAAGVPHWHPNQLRHTTATRVRSEAGPDVARAMLGQRSLEATEIYAEADDAKAAEIMRRIG